jgi:trehalose/maltose transport system substrate-binding protein
MHVAIGILCRLYESRRPPSAASGLACTGTYRISGDAIFLRDWPLNYTPSQAEGSPLRDKFDVAPLPRGRAGQAHTLGGHYTAVHAVLTHEKTAEQAVAELEAEAVRLTGFRTGPPAPLPPEILEDQP